jgi:predicted phage tail protein
MQKVRLIGNISKYGEVWHTNCSTIRDIFKLIECQNPDFKGYLVKAHEAGIAYEIKRGKVIVEHPEELLMSIGEEEEIIITELPAGSSSGLGKILAGVVLAIIGALSGQPWLVQLGTSLALSGVSQLLAPGPEVDGQQENDGFLFQGPANNIGQGLPVPVAYGELRVGGTAIAVSYEPYNANSFTAIPLNAGDATPTTNPSTNPDTNPPAPGDTPGGGDGDDGGGNDSPPPAPPADDPFEQCY